MEKRQAMLSKYIKQKNSFDSPLGFVSISDSTSLGQGGKGVVYRATLNGTELAIKILLDTKSQAETRFKAEYINVMYYKSKLSNCADYINYGGFEIEGDKFFYYLMKKYDCSLKDYCKKNRPVDYNQFMKIFESLSEAIRSLENVAIIHRDIKPDNVLIDNGDFVLSDFGIAHYDEDAAIKANTKKGERLANYLFSAPEQLEGKEISSATDLYSFGQVLYWVAFGETHQGVGTRHLKEVYSDETATIFDSLIYKCLQNKPKDRFQSIQEIYKYIEQEKQKMLVTNPFDDMKTFQKP